MARTSPCFYIAPTAISVSPNANGSASDIAVNVVRGAKIKVYSPGVPALGYSDVSFQQWTLTGRNRRLADSTKPYSIYARLAKSNKEDGYLVFAPKVASGAKWLDKYAYVTVGGLATGTADKNGEDYWYIKLGDVSLPTNNARTVTLDTGILGTDRFNTEWNIDPDQMPLRIELSATIESKDAGDKPYVEWDKELILKANLFEGWANANVQRFHHFTIQRNTGDASSDSAYNYPDEKSDSEIPSSGRQMLNGVVALSHARGTGDVFNGTVSSTWTVIAWGLKANVTDSTSSSSSVSSSSSASSKVASSSSSSTSGAITANVYEKLAEKSINIMAETVEQYALEMSSSVVNYDPSSDTYNPVEGIDVMVRATDQRGEVFKLTNAQLRVASLVVQYSVANLEQWNDCDFKGTDTAVAKANIPIEAFHLQQNVNVRIVRAQTVSASSPSSSSVSSTKAVNTTYKEIFRSHIALIRNGEDSKEREWIFLRSTVALSFATTADDKHKLLPSLITGGEVKPEEVATGADTNKNQDGWVPEGWWDDSFGTDKTYHYEYTAYRDYIKEDFSSDSSSSKSTSSGNAGQRGGHWGDFSAPRIWSYYAEDAVSYRCRWTLAGVEVYQLKCAYTGAFRGTLPLVATLMKRVGSGQEQEVSGKTVIVLACDGVNYSKTFNAERPTFTISTSDANTAEFVQYLNNVSLISLSASLTVDGEEHKFSIPVVREADKDAVTDTIHEVGDKRYLSKLSDDTAQGVITFAKGLVSEAAAKLEKGLETGGDVRSVDYDNAAEQGFSIEKTAAGRYQAFLTNLTIWGKAVFHELEIRKLSYSGGNIYLSGAGSKIIKTTPVKWGEDSLSWVECEKTDADCAGWKCYLLADDGTTATMNNWQEGDQARCQTMGEIVSAGSYADTSNRSYWRTIPDGGVSTANEKIYGTKTENYTDADGNTLTREEQVELYDGQRFAWVVLGKHSTAFDGVTEGDTATTELQDAPRAGDTIVLDGNRHRGADGAFDKQDRQNVIIMETTGDYAPRMACFANVSEYKHTVTKTVDGKDTEVSLSVFETSPRGGTRINSSRFEWFSDDGSTVNVINYRGDWAEGRTYKRNDQVNHLNAVWVCVAASGVSVTEKPGDNANYWKKVLSGGKGEPGATGNGIDHIETRFFAWKSGTFGTGFDSDRVWDDGSTTMPTDFNDDFPWLWQVTRTYYTNGTDVLGVAVCIGYKGKDGTNGADAVAYGVQVSPTYETWSDAKKHAGITLQFTKTTGGKVLSYGNVQQVPGTVKVYADGTEITAANNYVNRGNSTIIFDSFTFDGTSDSPFISTASVIAIELLVNDTVVATANYANGKQGADGKGALEIVCDPETIVMDTDDDGLVTADSLKNARAALMCLRDGKEVTGVTYTIGTNAAVNCSATVSDAGVVTITKVETQTVTVSSAEGGGAQDGNTVTVSKTSGSVTVSVTETAVSVTETATGVTYTKTVPFTVNMARYTGGLKADNKKFESAYNYLTNDGKSTDFTYYESKIRQTAKEISLTVSEKQVGRRNMLTGSALRKQDEGFRIVTNGNTSNGEGIVVNDGMDGVNALRATTKGTEQYSGLYWGQTSYSPNIKIKRNTKYTASVWVKSSNTGARIAIETWYHASAYEAERHGRYGYFVLSGSQIKAGEWQLLQLTVTTGADYDYTECDFWAASASGTTVLFCKPMLEEGEEYNGWTLSEQDYDYVGGNMLDATGTLTKTGNVETLDETTVTQGGYNGESASIRSELAPTASQDDFLRYSTTGMGLKAGEDYTLSFYARAVDNGGKLRCYLYPSTGGIFTEDSEGGTGSAEGGGEQNGALQEAIVLTTAWKRYWVHWRPTVNDPQYVLLRLLRPGTDRGSYNSSTSYNVGDVVLYGGTYYVCQKAGAGYTPGASGSSDYWAAQSFTIEIARPKLEVGATMTEWTERRADMVDKRALLATGIDIESRKITLTADNTTFRDNQGEELAVIDQDGLRSSKIATTDTGTGHTVIEGNSTVWFQKDGVTPGIAVFYDAAGVPHLAFYGTDGKQKYDIGPSGLQSLISSTQQAHSDTAYLRLATSAVRDYNSTLSFDWLYVAKGQQDDLRYIWRKQIPTTDASKDKDIYDGCVFTKNYYNTTNSVNWPDPDFLLPNGWYVEPNDGNLPMKLHTADEEAVLDPTKTLYYQTFYYYQGGKVARTVRAYMKRSTQSDQLVSKFEYAGSYDEI